MTEFLAGFGLALFAGFIVGEALVDTAIRMGCGPKEEVRMANYHQNYYLRILPSGEVQRWVSAFAEKPDADPCALHVCHNGCSGHTTWAREENHELLALLAGIAPPTDAPCTCVIIRSTQADESPVVFSPAEQVALGDPGQKPFGISFSWTIGLEWDCGLTCGLDVEGRAVIHDRNGRQRFRSTVPGAGREAEFLNTARELLF